MSTSHSSTGHYREEEWRMDDDGMLPANVRLSLEKGEREKERIEALKTSPLGKYLQRRLKGSVAS